MAGNFRREGEMMGDDSYSGEQTDSVGNCVPGGSWCQMTPRPSSGRVRLGFGQPHCTKDMAGLVAGRRARGPVRDCYEVFKGDH